MRLLVAACLLFGACAFAPGVPAGASGDDSSPDAGAPSPSPDAGGGTFTRSCRYPDPALRLCVELDDHRFAPHVTDGAPMQLDPTATLVSEGTRGTQGAARFTDASSLHIAETAALDLDIAFTLEMWVQPATSDQDADLLVNPGQYALRLDEGEVVCSIGGTTAAAYTALPTTTWTHVACTYSGGDLRLYADGRFVSAAYWYGGASTAGTEGTTIGGHFSGGIDDVRVYASGLSAPTLCTHANRTSCP